MDAENSVRKEPKKFTIKDNVIIGEECKPVETCGIAQILWESFSEEPDFVLQINVDTGEKTTFAEMKDRSIRCALWLRKQGVSKDDIIAISTPNQTDDVVPYIATLFIGAIFNPWNNDLTEANARRFFQTFQPKIMFACEKSIDQLARAAESEGIDCTFVVFGKHLKYSSLRGLLAEQSQGQVASFEYSVPVVDPRKQCSIILFSSGTTGAPKGAMISYSSFADYIAKLNIDDKRPKVILYYSTLSWLTGVLYILTCVKFRATRLIHAKFDPEETSKVVEKFKVDLATWTPSAMIECCRAKVFSRYNYSSLKTLITGGSKLSKIILEETQRHLPHCFVKNVYGMTELVGSAVDHTSDCKRIESAGYVKSGVKLKIIDINTGRVLGPNQEGEIWVYTSNNFLGYYKNPEETAKILDKDGWLHTGDLGYYDENGEITVTDRIKQLIKIKNFQVSSSEVEDILMSHPGVKDCAVIPVPHDTDIERPFAFVVKLPGAKVTEDELKELPTSNDKNYRINGGIAFVENIIYSSNGKKNLQLMKEKAKEYLCN